MLTSCTWNVTPDYQRGNTLKAFSSIDQVFSLQGNHITDDELSSVIRVEIDGTGYYVKKYIKAGKGLRRFVGRSRIRAEWENMLFFHEIGIPAAKVVAYGEEKNFGIMTRGVLITEEVSNSKDLGTMVNEESRFFEDKDWMNKVIEQVADIARRLHEKRFIHTDLKWRNILVTQIKKPKVYLIDCPAGNIEKSLFFTRGRVKDLACLDKIAKSQLSIKQRLRFINEYNKKNKLNKKDKVFLRKISTFFNERD